MNTHTIAGKSKHPHGGRESHTFTHGGHLPSVPHRCCNADFETSGTKTISETSILIRQVRVHVGTQHSVNSLAFGNFLLGSVVWGNFLFKKKNLINANYKRIFFF